MANKLAVFSRDVSNEMKKVSWPDKQQLQEATAVTILVCLIITLFVFVIDRVFAWVVDFIFSIA